VKEAVLVDADVDERRLEPRQDVVHAALVDVPDDRPRAAPLYVELADPPVRGLGLLLPTAPTLPAVSAAVLTLGRSLRLEDGDSCFATVRRDEYLLSHLKDLSYE
jgi:hypothetical protein